MREVFVIALVLTSALYSSAQPDHPSPVNDFEVSSVKPNKSKESQRSNVPLDTGNVYSTLDPNDKRTAASGYFVAVNQPLWRFLTFAYKLSGTQELALRFSFFEGLKSKAPPWVTGTFSSSAERFNVEARAPENSTVDEMRLMMQSLLAERFHLTAHMERREAPVFGLVPMHAGLSGPMMRLHPAADVCRDSSHPQEVPAPTAMNSEVGPIPPLCGVIAHVPSSENAANSFGGRAVSLSLLATSLPTMTGMAILPRPVVDQTNLDGLYDFTLHWSSSADPESSDNAALFREALKSQLGLDLKPTKAPIDVLVIDHIERPSDN